jgi:exonuclease VII small subunit
VIADREADIYQFYSRQEGCDLLIRSQTNRRTSQGILSDYLDKMAVSGEIKLKVESNNGRKKRQACLEIRFSSVRLLKPKNNLPDEAPWVDVHVVEALEKAETVPDGEDAIHWCLLTTHVVTTLAEALVIVGYYKARWQIEQLFRLLKKESLALEAAQLARGSALKKLCIMSLQVALVQLQLVTGRASAVDASLVWTSEAVVFLKVLQTQMEGKTKKQQCSYGAGTLAWTSWIIGRLGGWKGYASQSPPGPITMRRGLERFMSQFAGWQLALDNL